MEQTPSAEEDSELKVLEKAITVRKDSKVKNKNSSFNLV